MPTKEVIESTVPRTFRINGRAILYNEVEVYRTRENLIPRIARTKAHYFTGDFCVH